MSRYFDSDLAAPTRNRQLTRDAFVNVLVVAVVAELLKEHGLKALERFDALELGEDEVQVVSGPVGGPKRRENE